MESGVAVIFKILRHYITKDKANTIEKIITKWAPPNKKECADNNPTEAYIRAVVKRTSIKRDVPITVTFDMLNPIVVAICIIENGGSFIAPEIFKKAWELLQNK
jgi:hypothetical protein